MRKVWAVTATLITIVATGLVPASTAAAAIPGPIVANFSGDTTGAKANGFASAGAPQLFFYDTVNTGLEIGDYADQSHGKALALFGTGKLEIRLGSPTTAISLAFGNDDPSFSNTSDMAQLTLFRGATQVGQVDVNFNSNDTMDQTIGTSGGALFNRATIQYVNAGGSAIALTEVVDDITVNPLCTIAGNSGNNHLVGTSGSDVICGDGGNDVISAKGGNDLVYGGPGKDKIKGGAGQDHLAGGAGRDYLYGGKGKDQLTGGTGRDHLYGGKGRDKLKGGSGRDRCDGGSARDTSTSCAIRISIP